MIWVMLCPQQLLLPALTVANKGEGQALERLIPADQVIVNSIDRQTQELIFLRNNGDIGKRSAQFRLLSPSTIEQYYNFQGVSLVAGQAAVMGTLSGWLALRMIS